MTLTARNRNQHYADLQKVFHYRKRNLRKIIEHLGSWHLASRMTGKSIQLLKQVAGDNSCRTIGDTLAKELEARFSLPAGALQNERSPV